tara:strand:- start:852 stop:1433 length:582 start_codon:yes stop_codon:yes gene_type:complete
MEVKIDNFIGVFENAYNNEFCNEVIEFYNNMDKAGFTHSESNSQKQGKLSKDSDSLFLTKVNVVRPASDIHKFFLKIFWDSIYPEYKNKYGILDNTDRHQIYETKIQKTLVGGGFHDWHYEASGKPENNRLLNVQLYLNTVDEGGETEFLYLQRREKAIQGKLLIYPSAITHTHRGNTPLSNDKYILNGWVEF